MMIGLGGYVEKRVASEPPKVRLGEDRRLKMQKGYLMVRWLKQLFRCLRVNFGHRVGPTAATRDGRCLKIYVQNMT
jgi:hypothetical protein